MIETPLNPRSQEPQPEGDLALSLDPIPEETSTARSRRWQFLAAVIVSVLGILWGVQHFRSSAAAKGLEMPAVRPVPVSATAAKTGDMKLSLSGLGTVTPVNSVTVKSRVDGQLVRFPIQEGQFVRQGDLIAEIDPRPFQVQLMQAEGQKAKDEAAYKNATMDLQRFKSLFDQGILSRQQLDSQTSTVNQFEAALKGDQAQVESAKLNLAYSHITAPLSGKVGLRLVDPGNMVRSSDANGLCVINPVQPITVVFTVPADSIQQVLTQSAGGRKLPVEAFDRDLKNKLATGSVLAIDNQVDPTTGTVRIKALFDNQDNTLFPNQFVNARLLVDTLKGVIIIPTAAIQRSPQGTFVYRIKTDNTVEMTLVEIQATDGDSTSISKGLAAGDLVVTDGLERLRPGSTIAIAKPEAAASKKGQP
jgi:membrane fusion protein, multidrug efflux system